MLVIKKLNDGNSRMKFVRYFRHALQQLEGAALLGASEVRGRGAPLTRVSQWQWNWVITV